jgi:hypothetical protein
MTAAMGLAIKKAVAADPEISATQISQMLCLDYPDEPWNPKKSAALNFLKKNNLSGSQRASDADATKTLCTSVRRDRSRKCDYKQVLPSF